MKYKQDPPFSIQIELTEGCNLYCNFCGLRGIRKEKEKNFKFMTIENAAIIAKQIAILKWTSRIEFAMHGEPTMNPNLIDIVKVFREHIPSSQLMMTSNGGGLLKKGSVRNLFDSGLNILALDDYDSVNIVDKIITNTDVVDNCIDLHYYPENKQASPHKRWPKDSRCVIVVKDISSSGTGNHSVLNNHCGSAAPLNNHAEGKRCTKPFRELSIRWNGKIALCCNDWRGIYKCGDMNKESIKNIWHGEAFSIARRFLYHGRREFIPCKGCDALSYRVGLLPDKKGVINLPRPTSKDRKSISIYNSGRMFTKKIKREWE